MPTFVFVNQSDEAAAEPTTYYEFSDFEDFTKFINPKVWARIKAKQEVEQARFERKFDKVLQSDTIDNSIDKAVTKILEDILYKK